MADEPTPGGAAAKRRTRAQRRENQRLIAERRTRAPQELLGVLHSVGLIGSHDGGVTLAADVGRRGSVVADGCVHLIVDSGYFVDALGKRTTMRWVIYLSWTTKNRWRAYIHVGASMFRTQTPHLSVDDVLAWLTAIATMGDGPWNSALLVHGLVECIKESARRAGIQLINR